MAPARLQTFISANRGGPVPRRASSHRRCQDHTKGVCISCIGRDGGALAINNALIGIAGDHPAVVDGLLCKHNKIQRHFLGPVISFRRPACSERGRYKNQNPTGWRSRRRNFSPVCSPELINLVKVRCEEPISGAPNFVLVVFASARQIRLG